MVIFRPEKETLSFGEYSGLPHDTKFEISGTILTQEWVVVEVSGNRRRVFGQAATLKILVDRQASSGVSSSQR